MRRDKIVTKKELMGERRMKIVNKKKKGAYYFFLDFIFDLINYPH